MNENPLVVTASLRNLGSWISDDCGLDFEINHKVSQAVRAFGLLHSRLVTSHNLTLNTKIKVDSAGCLLSLLYEACTLYASHARSVEALHMKCIRCKLAVNWRDRLSHEEIIRRFDCSSI